MSVENMIKSAIDSSPVDFQNQFGTIMADRVKDALSAKYNEMSADAVEIEPEVEAPEMEASAEVETSSDEVNSEV
jgi:hypothetical protein